MKTAEEVKWDPITGDWEHIVQFSYDDSALDNAMRRNSGDKGFILKAEAKEKYSIPEHLLYDPIVREYLMTKDKLAERLMVEKYPDVVSTAKGQSKQRIFLGGETNAP
jgi:hypothetical protein